MCVGVGVGDVVGGSASCGCVGRLVVCCPCGGCLVVLSVGLPLLPGGFVDVSVGPEPVVVYPFSDVVVVVAAADAAVEAVAGFR